MQSIFRFAIPLAATLSFGAITVAVPTPAHAYDEQSAATINVAQGIALHGYDPVAYFTEGRPTPGSARYTATHEGAVYQFATEEHRARFEANPSNYAPQYGGFCAMGVALGKKLDVDPGSFSVVDGKLYLNVNADVYRIWRQDIPGNIRSADENWPAIAGKAPNTL